MALNFSIYETLKKIGSDFRRKSKLYENYGISETSLNGFLGGIAGGTSKLMLYPFVRNFFSIFFSLFINLFDIL